ncbi:hypothetical protein FB45DRAFT_764430, partial [Roridomyces roridus]
GWCWMAITALGNYDCKLGGQIIFWDFGFAKRFPSGATINIPPRVRFSIAAIQPGEVRFQITQYMVASPTWSRWPEATHVFSTFPELFFAVP